MHQFIGTSLADRNTHPSLNSDELGMALAARYRCVHPATASSGLAASKALHTHAYHVSLMLLPLKLPGGVCSDLEAGRVGCLREVSIAAPSALAEAGHSRQTPRPYGHGARGRYRVVTS